MYGEGTKMDSVHLHGAEDVSTAGHNMRSAASTMRDAASTIDSALDRQRLFLEDWLVRFEHVLAEDRRDRINRGLK